MAKIIQTFKDHPDYHKIGMIASHLGVVRENSLDGRKVRGIEIVFDRDMIDKIISETIEMQGIYQVMVEVSEGKLEVGDEIMAVVVGGDTREHVFPALIETVNRIKVQGGRKKEIF
ncbi:MAG: molybdenum cofactor biosynthesis protein MoaE [Deltaproteobacteria bacterium]|nr:molybdenum cofactor biosynthesis protein MoaE [Deltaproteobacteria bacterium]